MASWVGQQKQKKSISAAMPVASPAPAPGAGSHLSSVPQDSGMRFL